MLEFHNAYFVRVSFLAREGVRGRATYGKRHSLFRQKSYLDCLALRTVLEYRLVSISQITDLDLKAANRRGHSRLVAERS